MNRRFASGSGHRLPACGAGRRPACRLNRRQGCPRAPQARCLCPKAPCVATADFQRLINEFIGSGAAQRRSRRTRSHYERLRSETEPLPSDAAKAACAKSQVTSPGARPKTPPPLFRNRHLGPSTARLRRSAQDDQLWLVAGKRSRDSTLSGLADSGGMTQGSSCLATLG